MIQPMTMMSSAPITWGIAARNVFRALDNERKTASPQLEIWTVGMASSLGVRRWSVVRS